MRLADFTVLVDGSPQVVQHWNGANSNDVDDPNRSLSAGERTTIVLESDPGAGDVDVALRHEESNSILTTDQVQIEGITRP